MSLATWIRAGLIGVCLAGALSPDAGQAAESKTRPIANFALLDQDGKHREFRRAGGKVMVLFFTGNGCPVARQCAARLRELQQEYGPRGVVVWLVNSNPGDDRASIRAEAQELGVAELPVLQDLTQGLARHLAADRTGEVFAIDSTESTVFYRGALDDQVVEGARKPEGGRAWLREALDEFLAGKPVRTARTRSRGCRIHFEGTAGREKSTVSYASEVAPILAKHCVSCHSAGNVGSWSMSSYRKVRGMASMIEEEILTGRMPPWGADPQVGSFLNHANLSVEEARTLLLWVEQGAPRGGGNDPLVALKPSVEPDWPLGRPDIVLKLPHAETIPATGVLDYRHIQVEAKNAEPGWVGAVWVRPGNRKVVHHVIARLIDGGNEDHLGDRELYAGWAPGTTQGWYPPGSGKLLPANARFDFELHYTTCGTEETDATEIGLYLRKEPAASRFESVPVVNSKFEIPPGAPDHEVRAKFKFPAPATLFSLTPHMHLRGRSMRFELVYPDGRREVLASVPNYNFNWQHSYILEKPVRIPAGTQAILIGTYDNSASNPFNPDPAKAVRWGEQTYDEMFLGWYNVAWDPQPSAAPQTARR